MQWLAISTQRGESGEPVQKTARPPLSPNKTMHGYRAIHQKNMVMRLLIVVFSVYKSLSLKLAYIEPIEVLLRWNESST